MAHLRTLTKALSYQPMPLYRDTKPALSVKLDLNALCIRHPTETFFIHVKNPNLLSWGIELDDLLVVEKCGQFLVNDLLVIETPQGYRFYQYFAEINNEKILFSLDANEENLRITHWQEINVAGVITNVVHQMRHRTPQRYCAA